MVKAPGQPWDDGLHVVPDPPESSTGRRLLLTAADAIHPRPVYWAWKNRLALGTIGLLAGREGLGKSTLAYTLAAYTTQGTLKGHYHGTPKAVLVCATEDSWEHTIVPRLIAASADLALVYRVEIVTADDIHVGLTLPRDIHDLEQAATDTAAAMLILDPLMSRLGDLDTHRDAEVRQALEPLVAIADKTNMAVLGIIHHNKSGSTDPLQLVMGSKAFTAVARSVHTVIPDPDDDTNTQRLFGTEKNNLGRSDLPTFTFTIASHPVDTEEGTAWTGRLEWGDETTTTIGEAMRQAADADDHGATAEAKRWLHEYLVLAGGEAWSADIKKDAGRDHSNNALAAARKALKVTVAYRVRFPTEPTRSVWSLPSFGDIPSPRGEGTANISSTSIQTEPKADVSDIPDIPIPGAPPRARDIPPTPPKLDYCIKCGRDYLPDGTCRNCDRNTKP